MNTIILPNIFCELMANALQEEGKKKEKKKESSEPNEKSDASPSHAFSFSIYWG